MVNAERIAAAWGVPVPTRFAELYQADGWDSIELSTGEVFQLPLPVLSVDDIVAARRTASEWDIPDGLVPIMGDFHDLICLDYRSDTDPAVAALDDARNVRPLFDSFDALLDARRVVDDSGSDLSGVIKEKSWLDI